MRTSLALVLAFWPALALAQADKPLSAIDWLTRTPVLRDGPVLMEPPVTRTAMQPRIETQPLESPPPAIGLVPAATTGLPEGLWESSDPETLTRLIRTVPVSRSPAMQRLLFTLLLAEARPPQRDERDQVLLARIDRLIDLGAADPAQTLVELAGPSRNPALFSRWFDTTLLTGDEERSCAALQSNGALSRDESARIFCAVRGGNWQTAALLLEAGMALDIFPAGRRDLLDRFLSPDIYEGAPPLALPTTPTPLDIRLFEAIGERLPNAALPRAYASVDLRDVAGWKAQLEAAERLVRSGALEPNHLLGLYSDRRAAASGGVWDRVQAVQDFEEDLRKGNRAGIEQSLPRVWAAMQPVALEVPFASLFADQLAKLDLTGSPVRGLAWKIALLAQSYETVSRTPPDQTSETLFLAALAQGDPSKNRAPDALGLAITEGFSLETALPAPLRRMKNEGRLGEMILATIALLDQGAKGDLNALKGAMTALRAVGLEDTARRAALQLILLKADRT